MAYTSIALVPVAFIDHLYMLYLENKRKWLSWIRLLDVFVLLLAAAALVITASPIGKIVIEVTRRTMPLRSRITRILTINLVPHYVCPDTQLSWQ
jgi:hypothetical protein